MSRSNSSLQSLICIGFGLQYVHMQNVQNILLKSITYLLTSSQTDYQSHILIPHLLSHRENMFWWNFKLLKYWQFYQSKADYLKRYKIDVSWDIE